MLSKKLLGLSLVFFVTIHLTLEPFFTSFLNISKETSSLVKISVISFIIMDFLNQVYQFHISIKHLHKKFLEIYQTISFLFENFLNVLINNFSTTLKISSCSTNDISKSS